MSIQSADTDLSGKILSFVFALSNSVYLLVDHDNKGFKTLLNDHLIRVFFLFCKMSNFSKD